MFPVPSSRRFRAIALVAFLGSWSGVTATAEIIPFDSDRWVLADAEITEHEGRDCLIGTAFLPGADFRNGVIEFDLMVDGSRGYPGVTFRVASMAEYENFYCRPHVPNRPDALQYTPVFGGVAGWQLYNGPGFTAAAAIPAGEWIHVRIEVLDRQARVFFGDESAPALIIPELKHEVKSGPVGIRSRRDPSARFADFRITKTDQLELGPPPAPVHPRGLVTEWEISQPFLATEVDLSIPPDEDLRARLEWRPVRAEPNGLLDIARHAPRHQDGRADVVFARLWLEADAEETRQFSFGYSDAVWVYLDGRPLFAGNGSYRSRSETYGGIISLEDAVYLPLHAGRNELVFAVMESFGGWGLMGQDNAADFRHPALTQLWRVRAGQRIPESVLYDSQRDELYVTQYFHGGNESLARMTPDGEVLDREWITGLSRPTGMVLHEGDLWVVERRQLARIDVDEGAITETIPIPGAIFPNDVAFDHEGRAYVTDTRGHCIHRLEDGTFSVWLQGDEVHQPNGLLFDRDRLLFGNQGDGCLKAVDVRDGRVETVSCFGDDANVDGLRPDGAGGYVVSDFRGRVLHVGAGGEVTEWLNTTASGATCADFEYVPDRNLLVVPGLFDNRLTAYRVDGCP